MYGMRSGLASYRWEALFFRGFGAATPGASAAIAAAAAQYGIDPNLLTAVAKQESGLNQSAVSPVGAIGVMQLMPSTAASLGCDPNDMTANIECGAKYLSQLLTQFNGNTALALAAYNAGPGAVQKYGGIPPYTETQNYVSSIMGSLGEPVPSSDLPSTYDLTFGPTPAQLGLTSDSSPASASGDSSATSPLDISSLASSVADFSLVDGSGSLTPVAWGLLAASAAALVFVATR